jgi:hypothetical protein
MGKPSKISDSVPQSGAEPESQPPLSLNAEHAVIRNADHQQRQDGHGRTEATQYSGLMSLMTFLMISMLPIQLRASAACHPFRGVVLHAGHERGGRNWKLLERSRSSTGAQTGVLCASR